MKESALLILSIVCLFHLSGCSEAPRTDTKRRQAIVADVYDRYDGKEINFERQSINNVEIIEEPLQLEYKTQLARPIISKMDSEITTLADAFGNITESRFFSDDPLIKAIVVKTLANGEKTAFVYGQNGEIKLLPKDLIERGLDLRGSEIALSVGITDEREKKDDELLFTQDIPIMSSPLDVILENSPNNNISPQKEEVLAENNDALNQDNQRDSNKKEVPPSIPKNNPNPVNMLKQVNQINLMPTNKINNSRQGEIIVKKDQ